MLSSAWLLCGQTGPPLPPSQQSEGSDYPEPPTPAYRGLLGRLVQGQDGIAKPERQLYIRCAVGQEANAELPTYRPLLGDMIKFWYLADESRRSSQYTIKARQYMHNRLNKNTLHIFQQFLQQ